MQQILNYGIIIVSYRYTEDMRKEFKTNKQRKDFQKFMNTIFKVFGMIKQGK